jgi:hypothetical protein
LGEEPRPGHPPVALHGVDGEPQDFGRFLDGESSKVAQLHHAALAAVEPGQFVERLVQGEEIDVAGGRFRHAFVERHAQRLPAALGEAAAAGVVHQDAPHHLRAQRQEVRAALAAKPPGTDQLEVGLVDQCRGFETKAGAPAPEVPVRDPPQRRIHEIDQVIQRLRVAVVPGDEHRGDVRLALVLHVGPDATRKPRPGVAPFRRPFAEYR